ncbi:hypothetical protein AB0J43_05375 [Nonomuraea fuscirosea]
MTSYTNDHVTNVPAHLLTEVVNRVGQYAQRMDAHYADVNQVLNQDAETASAAYAGLLQSSKALEEDIKDLYALANRLVESAT